jgi:hypothetical protein
VFASVLAVPIAFGQVSLTTAQIAKRVSPAVVVIQGKTDFGEIQGSGFIVSKDGKIITNLHVIKDLNTAKVQLASGDVFDSLSVLAVDERRDLAIIKVAGFNLTTVELGDSDSLTVGERVVVVGSPLGLEATVTAGILSAIRDSGEGYKLLQTDAAVNHGNSGGPLVADNGSAVGVVSSIVRSDSAQGLNFAIPINYVRGLLNAVHEPISLGQMRNSLRVPTEPTNSLSLKDTLNWLNTSIPSGQIEYVIDMSEGGTQKVEAVKRQSKAWNLSSCTVTIGAQTVSTPQNCLPSDPLHTTDPDCHVSTTLEHYTVPLKLVSEVYIDRRSTTPSAPGMKIIAGDQWIYDTILATKSKDIQGQITLSDFPEIHPVVDYDSAYISFGEEAVAQRVADQFRHAADLCRESGTTMPPPELHGGGPSLKETLDWLKEKMPLATVNYVIRSDKGWDFQISISSRVFSLDSCTGVLGSAVNSGHAEPYTSRYTVPLGALIGFSVERVDESHQSDNDTFISGDRWMYRLLLTTKSKDISVVTHTTINATDTSNLMVLCFNDESLANRVMEAFKHAADLCRRKEPF